MPNIAPLVQSVDPFIKQPSVLVWTDEDGEAAWQIRPLWIVMDLNSMHTWLNEANCLTNQTFSREKNPLIWHYRNRLFSEKEQSLIVLRKNLLVGQIDIVPAASSPLGMMHPVDGDGVALYYVFPGDHLSVDYWQYTIDNVRQMMVGKYAVRSLYLEIPVEQRILYARANSAGFVQINEYWSQERQVGLFEASVSD